MSVRHPLAATVTDLANPKGLDQSSKPYKPAVDLDLENGRSLPVLWGCLRAVVLRRCLLSCCRPRHHPLLRPLGCHSLPRPPLQRQAAALLGRWVPLLGRWVPLLQQGRRQITLHLRS